MVHAGRRHPAVYRGIMKNERFRRAYGEIDARASQWLDNYPGTMKRVYARMKGEYNLTKIEKVKQYIIFRYGDNKWDTVQHFEKEYDLFTEALEEPEMKRMISKLHSGYRGN
jgi:hypothetical protein